MRAAVVTVALASAAAAAGCGGGTIDPEFYEPVVVPDRAPPVAPDESGELDPRRPFDRPKLVVIRADWCGFCRDAEPAIFGAYERFQTKVDLIVLDVSDDRALRRADREARLEGVGRFFSTYAGRTPTVGVFLGPDDGRLVRGPLDDPETLSRELEHAVARFGERR